MAVNQMTAGTQRRSRSSFFRDQRKWIPYLFLSPFFITFAIFTLYPILRGIMMGFEESLGYTGQWEWVGVKNYVEALTNDRNFKQSAINFVYYAAGSLLSQIPAGLLLAWLLTSARLKFKGAFRTLFFIPSILPGVTVGIIGAWFFNETRGLANAIYLMAAGAMRMGDVSRIKFGQHPEFIIPMLLCIAFWQWMGNHAIFFIAGMSGIDTGIIEAAIVDGASPWQRFRHIVMPLLMPIITYVTITITAGSLMNYDIPYIFLTTGGAGAGGAGGKGWFFLTYITDMAFDKMRMGYASAMGWLVFLLAIVITVIQLKLFRFGEQR